MALARMNEQGGEGGWQSTVVHTVITALYLWPLQEKYAELGFLLTQRGGAAKTYALILPRGT